MSTPFIPTTKQLLLVPFGLYALMSIINTFLLWFWHSLITFVGFLLLSGIVLWIITRELLKTIEESVKKAQQRTSL